MNRTIFHIDVNSAFLSWEAVARLNQGATQDLRMIPSAVAGDSKTRHGIILAKSFPAKKYGISTGEPTISALKKCPSLTLVAPNFKLYTDSSQALFHLLENFSDRIETYSIDECFLEYTGMEQLFGSPLEAAQKMKKHIWEELGFTVNIGISSNKLLAKMAGELEKPDKIITLYPYEIPRKLWPLPIEELFMVGRRIGPRLRRMGISSIGDLAHFPIECLHKEFKSYGYLLHAYANGLDESPVSPIGYKPEIKSIGNSTTIPFDITDREAAYKVLLSLCETAAARLRLAKMMCREVAVSIKFTDFHICSHQKKILTATDCTNAVFQTAKEVFDALWHGEAIRHIGVRFGCLENGVYSQLSMESQVWEKHRNADQMIDSIRRRYGKNSVKRSVFLTSSKE